MITSKLKEIKKPNTPLERNDLPAYKAKNGYTYESFTAEDGTVYERAVKGSIERWFIFAEE